MSPHAKSIACYGLPPRTVGVIRRLHARGYTIPEIMRNTGFKRHQVRRVVNEGYRKWCRRNRWKEITAQQLRSAKPDWFAGTYTDYQRIVEANFGK